MMLQFVLLTPLCALFLTYLPTLGFIHLLLFAVLIVKPFLCLFFFFFLPLRHVEVPRLGVESELWLPAYTTATATQDPSRVCDLHHSSRQHWILNLLSEARDWPHILMDIRQIR